MLKNLFIVVLIALLFFLSIGQPEPKPKQITQEQLYGTWSKTFGDLTDEGFMLFLSGVATIYFFDDGTGRYIEAWDEIVTYFTWQISDDVITLVDDDYMWNGRLLDGAYGRVIISWGGESPHWGHVNSDWGMSRRRQ